MALVKCPDCGTDLSDRAPACPKCGAPLRGTPGSPTTPSSTTSPLLRPSVLWLGAIMFAVGASTVLVFAQLDVSPPGTNVANLDLMEKRQMGVLVGSIIAALGFLSLLLGYALLPPSASVPDPWTLPQLLAGQVALAAVVQLLVWGDASNRERQEREELARLLGDTFSSGDTSSGSSGASPSAYDYSPDTYSPPSLQPSPTPVPELTACECFAWDLRDFVVTASKAASPRTRFVIEKLTKRAEISGGKCGEALEAAGMPAYRSHPCMEMMSAYQEEIDVLQNLRMNRRLGETAAQTASGDSYAEECFGHPLSSRPAICPPVELPEKPPLPTPALQVAKKDAAVRAKVPPAAPRAAAPGSEPLVVPNPRLPRSEAQAVALRTCRAMAEAYDRAADASERRAREELLSSARALSGQCLISFNPNSVACEELRELHEHRFSPDFRHSETDELRAKLGAWAQGCYAEPLARMAAARRTGESTPQPWARLRAGMDKDAVRGLLGEPKWTERTLTTDFWLYKDRSILGSGWVAFEDDGVSRWRKP